MEVISDSRIGVDTDKGKKPKLVARIRSKVKKVLSTTSLQDMWANGKSTVNIVNDIPITPPPKKPILHQEVKESIIIPQPTEVSLWIVIPTHNRPEKFKVCLKRVMEQIGPRDHVIAVASGFSTFQAVREASTSQKITGILCGDVNVNIARSLANRLIPEDAVVVETGDNDYIMPGAIERLRKGFEDPDIGVVYGNLQYIDPDGTERGAPMKKPAWVPGIMHRRCEVKGLHAYRKTIYTRYGGWYESENPAGDHANAMRWEDAGVKFLSVGGKPLVKCEWDIENGMSANNEKKRAQHLNSQSFARGEYKRKYSVAMVCWAVAGRRTKMLALLDKICDPDQIKIYASSRGRYGLACDTDEHIKNRTVWWNTMEQLDEWLPAHQVNHLFVDRMNFATRSAALDRRVVVDVCDLRTQRIGAHDDIDEKVLCTSPNVWLMFVSEGHRDYVCEKYKLPIERTHIVKNLPMKSWRPEEPLDPEDKVPNSIVYFGGITAKKGHTAAYRYYYDLFKMFKDSGIDVHIYPSGSRIEEVKSGYAEFNVHERFDHRDIYKVLRKYSVGLAGYEDRAGCPAVSHDYAMKCYPNKATDYMMAGIPTLSYALGLSECDVKNWGVCVPKGRANEMVDAYHQALTMHIDYERWQSEFCMESQAPKIIEAYDWVMSG